MPTIPATPRSQAPTGHTPGGSASRPVVSQNGGQCPPYGFCYGSYDRLTQDGLTQWHPAFLALGATLDLCAAAYRRFCKQYKPKPKPERKSRWGEKKLAALRQKLRAKKVSPGQKSLWESWNLPFDEIQAVAKDFVLANCLNPEIVRPRFEDTT